MRILLVDDEPRLRQAIARSLTVRGYQVTEAENAVMALSLADSGNVDLLVLDINLPDATGWDVLRTLKQQGTALRTVVFSAVPPTRSRIAEFAPFGVLHKPFPISALLSLVERASEGNELLGGELRLVGVDEREG
jgi:two-component system, NtrC family, response regulator